MSCLDTRQGCVFNCQLNYDNGPKKTVFFFPDEKKDYDIESIGLNLSTETAGNRRKNHVYDESTFLNHIIIKQGLKESNKD